MAAVLSSLLLKYGVLLWPLWHSLAVSHGTLLHDN